MKIDLPVPLDIGCFYDVEATLLPDLAPHLAEVASFVVHITPHHIDHWTVANLETGLHIAKDESRAKAIRKARERLKGQTVEGVIRAYRKGRKKYGMTSRFDGFTSVGIFNRLPEAL
jgi:hypothetical protein